MISRMSRLRLLSIFTATIVGLILAEALLRIVNYHPGTMDPEMYVANSNDLLPYKLRPNYSGYLVGQEVNIDAGGDRVVSPRYSDLRRSSESRPEKVVLILGDSGVFGYGLSDQDTIGSQLQRNCFDRQLNYQVNNIGVPGYTSWNEYVALAEYLKEHSVTDIVLLYMPNDLTLDNDYFGIGKGNQASFSRENSRLHRMTRFLYSHLYVSDLVGGGIKHLASLVRERPKEGFGGFDPKQSQQEIDYSMEALRRLQVLCNEKGIVLRVGIYRDVAYYDGPADWLQYEQTIKRELDRYGIRSFLAKSHIDNLGPRQARVFWNDPHPSARAVAFIVSDILKELS